MANPQIEDGHIDIAHPIAEALAKINLSAHESRLLWTLLRKTYGWHRKTDFISLNQFSEITGIPRANIPRIIRRLEQRSIITVSRINRITEYGFQKDYELWDDGAINSDAINSDAISNDSKIVSNQIPKVVSNQIPTKETKETRQKKIYGEFKNVLLTDEEYQKLVTKFGEGKAKSEIENLSSYMASRSKRYKSHYATILNWQRRNNVASKASNRGLPKAYTPTPEYPDL